MPLPIVNFGYTKNGLEITFINLTLNLNTDSQVLWDFGDGNSSIELNPVHTYENSAAYNVKLEVTNLDEPPVSQLVLINLGSGPIPTVMYNIENMIDLYSPSSIVGIIKNHNQKEFLIAKWQLYLQPLVEQPFKVDQQNTHDVYSWPPLVNSLIAKLVVIDIIMMDSSAFLLNTAAEGQNSSTIIETGGGTSNSKGGIKSIETGPTKIERYENKDTSSNSEKIANLGKAYQQLIRPGGLLDELKASTCQEANRVRIFLPMCGMLDNPTILIEVGKDKNSGHNANPFGVSQRML